MIVIWVAITLLCVLILVWSMPRCIVAMWLPMLVRGHAMRVVAMVCAGVYGCRLYYAYVSMLVWCRYMCVPCVMCSWPMSQSLNGSACLSHAVAGGSVLAGGCLGVYAWLLMCLPCGWCYITDIRDMYIDDMFMLAPSYSLVVESQGFCDLKIKMKNEMKNICGSS